MKNFITKWLVSLVSVGCMVACNDTDDTVPELPGDGGTDNVEIIREDLSAADSSFFNSILPYLERNGMIRIDSRDDLSAWLPDTLQIPADMDFERYTYLVGCAELYSPSYYVQQDTLAYTNGRFRYLFDYFYSSTDTDAHSLRLICGKYAKLAASGGISLSVNAERGLGLVYNTEILNSGLSTPDFNMEDRQFVLIRTITDFLNYISWPEAFNYTFFYTMDYARYSVILWKRKTKAGLIETARNIELRPLSPKAYRYVVASTFEYTLLPEAYTRYMASVIDKVPDDVTIDCEFKDTYK